MLLDGGATAAYSPPPALLEPAERRGSAGPRPTRPAIAKARSDTSEARLVKPAPDPAAEYAALYAARHDANLRLQAGMVERIHELLMDALIEAEPFSHASLSDFLLFVNQVPFARRPAIYLLDNGNLRAVWKNAHNEQAAFQFRGHGIVHCVFFLKRNSPRLPLNRETLIDLIPQVRERLPAFKHLLQA